MLAIFQVNLGYPVAPLILSLSFKHRDRLKLFLTTGYLELHSGKVENYTLN